MELKNVYKGREIKFYDYLMSLRNDLIVDFFKQHPNYTGQDHWKTDCLSTPDGWGMSLLKYNHLNEKDNYAIKKERSEDRMSLIKEHDEFKLRYPTAYSKIIDYWGADCNVAAYLTLHPGVTFKRHTDDDNRDNKFIRIHIPLIIPEGDVGLEVYGEQLDWADLLAFNNQKTHSVWNWTDQPRLIFLFDLSRSVCGIPPDAPWDRERDEINAPRFPKTE